MLLREDLKAQILNSLSGTNGSRFVSVIESLNINTDDIQFDGRTLKIKPPDRMYEDPKEMEEFFNDLDGKLAPLGLLSIVSEGACIVIDMDSVCCSVLQDITFGDPEDALSPEERAEEILAAVDIIAMKK